LPRRSWLPVTSPILRCLSRAGIRASSRRRGFSSSAPTPARFARSDGSSRRTSARRRKRSRPDRSRLDRWAGPAGPVHRRRPDRDRPPLPGLACRRADALPLARRRSAAAYDHTWAARALSARPLAQARTTSLRAASGAWACLSVCWLVRAVALLLLLGALRVGFSFALAVLYPSAGAAAGALPIGPAGATNAGAGAAAAIASGVGASQALDVALAGQALAVLCGVAIPLYAAGGVRAPR
jgi:hypothetical protein